MARLKVYEAEIDGVHDWIVAAPNQRAALDAFGVHQDLFGQGLARVSDDPGARDQALAAAGAPLRRLKGGKGPFQPANLGGLDAWTKAADAAAKPGRKAAPPSRARLDKAKAALDDFEREAEADLAELASEREALERREEALRQDQAGRRAQLRQALDKEKAAYRKAGGRP